MSSDKILEIDLSQKNSTPFVPDGVIRSLNLDYDGSERSEVNGDMYVSLKNNVGHSFVPFGMYQEKASPALRGN